MGRNVVRTEVVTRMHRSGVVVEIPVATIEGARSGPEFAVMSGMHAGEYAGILAAQRLIQTVGPEDLCGTLRVIPVISTQAFMARNMQLSPVDQREVHYYAPGSPGGSYTEFHVDVLWSILKSADYVIDLHAGEFAQALLPWVPVPLVGPQDVQRRAFDLAAGFRVRYVEHRKVLSSIPKLSAWMADEGIPNVWAEIGKNGLPTEEHVAICYDGVISALQTVGMLPGEPERPPQEVLTGHRFNITANQSGVWHPAVVEGDTVEEGQLLGEMTDYFGATLEVYRAPARSLVLYYWSSRAINHTRRPHGYDWHAGLVSLIVLD